MQNKQFTAFLLGLIILSLLITLCSCSRAARKPGPNEPIPNRTRADEMDIERARHITEKIDRIHGVRQSTVVVAGSKAYVGLELQQGIAEDEERINEVENIVADRIKCTEESIHTVYVSSDRTLVIRLKKIDRGIDRGDPVTRYARELTDIGRQVKPRSI